MKTISKQRRAAKSVGISLVIMTVAAMIAMGMVFSPLFEADLKEFESLLRGRSSFFLAGLMLWGVIFITDFIVSIAVCNYYQTQNSKRASITAGLRMLYTLILGYAIIQLIQAYSALNAEMVNYQVIQGNVLQFRSIWQNGLIVFGLHLITLAPLVCKKRSIQLVISILLLLAGIGYVISNSLALFIQDYESIRPNVEMVFILPMILGELGFAIWMLVRGGKTSVLNQPLSDPA